MFLVTGDDGLHTNGLRALLLRGQPGPAVHGEPGLLLPAAGGVPGGAAVPQAGLPGHVRHGGSVRAAGGPGHHPRPRKHPVREGGQAECGA